MSGMKIGTMSLLLLVGPVLGSGLAGTNDGCPSAVDIAKAERSFILLGPGTCRVPSARRKPEYVCLGNGTCDGPHNEPIQTSSDCLTGNMRCHQQPNMTADVCMSACAAHHRCTAFTVNWDSLGHGQCMMHLGLVGRAFGSDNGGCWLPDGNGNFTETFTEVGHGGCKTLDPTPSGPHSGSFYGLFVSTNDTWTGCAQKCRDANVSDGFPSGGQCYGFDSKHVRGNHMCVMFVLPVGTPHMRIAEECWIQHIVLPEPTKVTCGDVKEQYREQVCCGKPEHSFDATKIK